MNHTRRFPMSGLRVLWRHKAVWWWSHPLQRIDVVKLELLTHCLKPQTKQWVEFMLRLLWKWIHPKFWIKFSESSETPFQRHHISNPNKYCGINSQAELDINFLLSVFRNLERGFPYSARSPVPWKMNEHDPFAGKGSACLGHNYPMIFHLTMIEGRIVYCFGTFGCIFFDTLFRGCLTSLRSFVCPNRNKSIGSLLSWSKLHQSPFLLHTWTGT